MIFVRILKKIAMLPVRIIKNIPSLPRKTWNFINEWGVHIVLFASILILYLTSRLVIIIASSRFFPRPIRKLFEQPCIKVYNKILSYSRRNDRTISRINLIDISLRNMKVRTSRSIITIGGMAVGIAAIVFLVSIGHGLQKLVISRVARLDEMKQVDVSTQPGSQVNINDRILESIEELSNVDKVLPLISVVGRVNFQNSVSDMAVYGVTADYLKQSAVQPVQGSIFESNDLVRKFTNVEDRFDALESENVESDPDATDSASLTTEKIVIEELSATGSSEATSSADIKGITTVIEGFGEYGQILRDVTFSIHPDKFVKVRKSPSTSSEILGYTKRSEGTSVGEEIWGDKYTANENGLAGFDKTLKPLGLWIKAPVLLWDRTICDTKKDIHCEQGQYTLKVGDDGQMQVEGYMAELNMTVDDDIPRDVGSVLAAEDDATSEDIEIIESSISDLILDIDASGAGELDLIKLASEAGIIKKTNVNNVPLDATAEKQAVVNRAALNVLGIVEEESIGKTFEVSFIVTSNLLENVNEKIQSISETYTIVGVVPDDRSPFFYVPFIDLRGLGITNFSQIKVVAVNQDSLPEIRQKIEALGFVTASVTDTVEQIDQLFSTVRQVLALVGMVALAVASLGMFNTLTVSLLERTREVGLMKAMGMKSHEVQDLFLTESMIMGFFGGVGGVTIGYIAGKLLGIILSLFSLAKGAGYIDIAYIPPVFIIVVMSLSIFVGIVTGIYPSHRAKNISALNALRYE